MQFCACSCRSLAFEEDVPPAKASMSAGDLRSVAGMQEASSQPGGSPHVSFTEAPPGPRVGFTEENRVGFCDDICFTDIPCTNSFYRREPSGAARDLGAKLAAINDEVHGLLGKQDTQLVDKTDIVPLWQKLNSLSDEFQRAVSEQEPVSRMRTLDDEDFLRQASMISTRSMRFEDLVETQDLALLRRSGSPEGFQGLCEGQPTAGASAPVQRPILRRTSGAPMAEGPRRSCHSPFLNWCRNENVALAWDLFQMLLSVIGVALCIRALYASKTSFHANAPDAAAGAASGVHLSAPTPTPTPAEPQLDDLWFYEMIEIVLSGFFVADLILVALLSGSLLRFVTRWYTWVDVFSLVPLVTIFFPSLAQFGSLAFVRMFRLLRIMRAYRLLYLTESGTIQREIALLIYIVVIIVLVAAGVFLIIEEEEIGTFHDGVYFVVATITTVGYGDLSPKSGEGRLTVCLFILLAIVVVPMRINKVLEYLACRSPYAGAYAPEGRQHVVVTGTFDQRTLYAFLHEFFHSPHGFADTGVCVLAESCPYRDIRLDLEGRRLAPRRVKYLQGSAESAQDLRRALVHRAVAVFVLAPKNIPEDQTKSMDAEIILSTVSIRQYNPHVPIFAQVLSPGNRPVLFDVGATGVVCINELRMQLLAAACHTPGLHTIAANLVTSVDRAHRVRADWAEEYVHGMAHSVFEFAIPGPMVGRSFRDACDMLYTTSTTDAPCALIAVRSRAHKGAVLVNPDVEYRVAPDDQLLVLGHTHRQIRDSLAHVHKKYSTSGLPQRSWSRLAALRRASSFVGLEEVAVDGTSPDPQPQNPDPDGHESDVKDTDDGPSSDGTYDENEEDEEDEGEEQEGPAVRLGLAQRPQSESSVYALEDYAFDRSVVQLLDHINPKTFTFALRPHCGRWMAPKKKQQRHSALSKELFLHCVPPGLQGHAVVLGWASNAVDFVLVLRNKRLAAFCPIVFVAPVPPTDAQCHPLSFFSDVYIIVADFDKCCQPAAIHRAKVVVVLPSSHSPQDMSSPPSKHTHADSHVLMLTMRLMSNFTGAQPLVGLNHLQNSRFLDAFFADPHSKGGMEPEVPYLANLGYGPAMVAGRVYPEALPDNLLLSLHWNGSGVELTSALLGAPGFRTRAQDMCSQLFLMSVPEDFFAGSGILQDTTYGGLFLHLLRGTGVVAVGLLRERDAAVKHRVHAGAVGQGARTQTASAAKGAPRAPQHVLTNPKRDAVIYPTDMVYVLSRQQPSEKYEK